MGNVVEFFCENCGSKVEIDGDKQTVFCANCGAKLRNPKFNGGKVSSFFSGLKEDITNDNEEGQDEDLFTAETGGGFSAFFSDEAKAGFNKLKGMLGGTEVRTSNSRHREDFDDDFEDAFEDDFDGRRIDDRRREDDRRRYDKDRGFDRYYAVIKRGGLFYSGECPGISFTSVSMCDSYEECLDEIEEKLGDQVGSFNRKFKQPDPSEFREDRDTRIVTVYPKRKR